MKINHLFVAVLLMPFFAKSQMQQPNAAEIAQHIDALQLKASALYIAAHPDDENTRLLAYLAKELKVKTAYLSLTRGDGGQNLIGNEQAELLGQIRTQELLAARKVDGAKQFFTTANDFGFSKTADETFAIWNKERILANAVWVIRNFKPDVIITRFPEDKRAGHGHHAASAIIAREAFVAAADPKRFPEQLKNGVTIWQAKRILWNTFNFGGNNTTAADQLKIDVGVYNPVLGKSYGEIAAISRTNHKSQGFGSALQRGEAIEYFTHIAGSQANSHLFDGVDMQIGNAAVRTALAKIKSSFNIMQPAESLPSLLGLKRVVANDINFNHKLLDEIILACAGVWAEAIVPESSYAASDIIPITVNVISRAVPVNVKMNGAEGQATAIALNKNTSLKTQFQPTLNDITQPYYLKKDHGLGAFEIDDLTEIGAAENTNAKQIKLDFTIDNTVVSLSLPIYFKSVDPIKGEIYQPLVIAPKVTATFTDQAYLFANNTPKDIQVQLKSFTNNAQGTLALNLPNGWKSMPATAAFNLPSKGDSETLTFKILPKGDVLRADMGLTVSVGAETSNLGYKNIQYDHIPAINLFPKANAKLVTASLKIGDKNIAYIEGAGDVVANYLQQVGYQVTRLTVAQALSENLDIYDAVITGIRFFNVTTAAKEVQQKLLRYVENGGVLLNQYNVNNGLKAQNIGPYPFKIVNKRVTEEDAAVNILAPSHQVLNYPNKIVNADFDGWVQERGLYFAEDIDSKYQTVLAMADKGEEMQNGSLLVAQYGKGKFVYTSLAFFRQIPAGVPGAYKLLANLLAKAPKQ